MKKQRVVVLGLLLCALASFAYAGNGTNQQMRFKNGRGSILYLTLHRKGTQSGQLTGTFKTAVASKKCRDVIGKPQPISGSYTGNAIAFTVSYPSCGAVLAVVGNFDKNNNNIETLWLDTHQGKHTNGRDWNTRNIGYDQYKLVNKGSSQ